MQPTACASRAACIRRTDQLPPRDVGALPPYTGVPVSQPAPAAHRPLQIVLLHAYQKGFSAMEVATMFSFYEVRRTAVQSGALQWLGPGPGCCRRPAQQCTR